MKKKWMPLLALVAALGLVFAGCKKPDDPVVPDPSEVENNEGDSDTTAVVYSLDVTTDILTLDDDGDNYFEVTTNGTFTVEVDDESVCTATADGNKVTVTGVKAGDTFITVTSVEDEGLSKEVNVTVNATKMVLTLDYSKLSAKEEVKTVKVTYGWAGKDAGDEHYAPEVTAAIGSDYKATVTLERKYADTNGWIGFNNTKIKLLAEDDAELEAVWDALWCEFTETGTTFTASDKVSTTGLLTLNFTGFEIPGGSVSITYGHDGSGVNFKTESAVVAVDGKSATVTLSNDYAKEGKWFNNTEFVVKDAEENEITPSFTPWFDFATEMTLELVVDKKTYTQIGDSVSITTNGSLQLLKSADDFKDLTIAALKIEIETTIKASGTWMKCYADSTGNTWDNEINLDWKDCIATGKTITESGVIESIIQNGLYIADAAGGEVIVTVSYVAE